MTGTDRAHLIHAILDRAHTLDGMNLDAVARTFGQESFPAMLQGAEFFEEDTGGGFSMLRASLQDAGVEVTVTDGEADLPEGIERFAMVLGADVDEEDYAITVEGDRVTWRSGRLVDEGRVDGPTTPASEA